MQCKGDKGIIPATYKRPSYRMPRKYLKRWSPDPAKIRNKQPLKVFNWLFEEPNLFHLNRHSVSTAAFIGLVICFLPIPGQMLLGTLAAFLLRCNLAITFALIWISNPVTFPVIVYTCYGLGVWLLRIDRVSFHFEPTLDWLTSGFLIIWQPLLMGCLTTGLVLGSCAYLLTNWGWRWYVAIKWRDRKTARISRKPR